MYFKINWLTGLGIWKLAPLIKIFNEKRHKKSRKKLEKKDQSSNDKEKRKQEAEIDDELDQTFPASDPPSYSKPENDFDKWKEK